MERVAFSLSLPWTLGALALGGLVYALRRKSTMPMPHCSAEFRAANHGGTRSMKQVTLIVLHSTEGGSARSTAQWFANPASGGSTQYVVDDTSCYETLPDDVVPYGAPGANTIGLHVEMSGYAAWTRAQWLAHDGTLRAAAGIVAMWAARYGIPLKFLDAAALQRGERAGVTTHWEVTKGLNHGSGHTDPGPGFPLDVLAGYAGLSV